MQQGHTATPKPAILQAIDLDIEALRNHTIYDTGEQSLFLVQHDKDILDILSRMNDALNDLYNLSRKEGR